MLRPVLPESRREKAVGCQEPPLPRADFLLCPGTLRGMVATYRTESNGPSVRLIQPSGTVVDLLECNSPTQVPPGALILTIEGAKGREIQVDGKRVDPPNIGTQRVLSLDLGRSTGYHQIRVGGCTFCFATQDTKLRIDGIAKIAEYISPGSALGWDRQLLFSDGGTLDTKQTRYAWLWKNTAEITARVESIGRTPGTQFFRRSEMRAEVRGRLDIPATLRAIRNDYTLLVPRTGGAVTLHNGRSFTPSRAAIRSREKSFLTKPNLQTYALARAVLALYDSVRESIPKTSLQSIETAAGRLRRALALPLFRSIARAHRPRTFSGSIGGQFSTDARYAFIAAKYREMARRGWQSGGNPEGSDLAFVRYADEIYQAFVAFAIGKALDCAPMTEELEPWLTTPSFRGADVELYYDTPPPPKILTTWRSATDRPDDPRPDLLLHYPLLRKLLIIDAKYRNDGNRASKDSLYEVQYYLNTFRLRHAAICYPPSDSSYRQINLVSCADYTIAEIPLSPNPDIIEYLRDDVAPTLRMLSEDRPS